ncbi:hypothetical protein TWF718_006658 [Orbilia javanica]|uniref:Uncharacterized protein n=1 Tax=Orbilia javanica TaxID=47235 RepID=A0AAN8N1I0_9PEZI
MKPFCTSFALIRGLQLYSAYVLGVASQSATTCTQYSSQTGCPAVYDPCCAFNCIAAGGMFSSCLDFDDTRPQVICSSCPSSGLEATSSSTATSTSTSRTSTAPASTCTPYFLMTRCPEVYDPCCAFSCVSAGGRGSTCLDYDDTRPQVVCKACPSIQSSLTTKTEITPVPETSTAAATTTTSTNASTCTPYFLMTGCPKIYDPCCAFNCISAGGRGSTCLDYDDTRPQVVCKACPLGSTSISETSIASSSTIPTSSKTAISSVYPTDGVSTGLSHGNISTSTPGLPTPTKDRDSGAAVDMMSVGAALGLGLLCAVLVL